MCFSARSVLLGSAFLLAALPAAASDEAMAPAAAPAPRATMNCPGISSVPMTADAAQALPLHLLRNLSCGESVVMLSDSEGYTVRVRSADGTAGYVARMYLNMGAAPSAPDHQPLSATAVNNVVRWQAGAPGCDQFFSKGHTVESATANGLTVQVSLEDSGWKLRATVAVSNRGEEVVELFPALITLDELQPHLKSLLAQDPAKLSHVVNHQVLLTQANAQPSPSAVAYHKAALLRPALSRIIFSPRITSANMSRRPPTAITRRSFPPPLNSALSPSSTPNSPPTRKPLASSGLSVMRMPASFPSASLPATLCLTSRSPSSRNTRAHCTTRLTR